MKKGVNTTLCFFKDLYKTLKVIDKTEAGWLMTALFAHGNGEELEGLEEHPVAAALYVTVVDQVDRLEEYRRIQSENGKAGGVKSGETRSETKRNEATTEQSEAPYPYPYPYPVPDKKEKRFTAPTIEDVEQYAKEKGLNMNAERFVDYYASKGWRVGSSPMKDWRAAARNWAARDEKKPAAVFNFDQRKNDYDKYLDETIGW